MVSVLVLNIYYVYIMACSRSQGEVQGVKYHILCIGHFMKWVLVCLSVLVHKLHNCLVTNLQVAMGVMYELKHICIISTTVMNYTEGDYQCIMYSNVNSFRQSPGYYLP